VALEKAVVPVGALEAFVVLSGGFIATSLDELVARFAALRAA